MGEWWERGMMKGGGRFGACVRWRHAFLVAWINLLQCRLLQPPRAQVSDALVDTRPREVPSPCNVGALIDTNVTPSYKVEAHTHAWLFGYTYLEQLFGVTLVATAHGL